MALHIPMGTDQFLNQISTLVFGWEILDFVTMINQKSTYQPKINQLSTKFQPFNIDISTSNLVELWLRSWYLVDNCYKIIDFSTKYQCWGWLRNVEAQRWINVEKLICAHWDVSVFSFVYSLYNFKLAVASVQSHIHSYTPRTLRTCCNQSKFRILWIRESSACALFLYNCTPNISHSADASVSIA